MRKILTASVFSIFLYVFVVHAAPPFNRPSIKPVKPPITEPAASKSFKELMQQISPAQAKPSKVVAPVFSESEIAIKKQRAQELIEANPAVSDIAKNPKLLNDLRDIDFRRRYFEFESNPQTKKDIIEFLQLQKDLRRAGEQKPSFIKVTKNVLQAAQADKSIPEGAVFRMINAEEMKLFLRDGYVTATAYPNNPSPSSIKADVNTIVQSPQTLQRALIHHDINGGTDSFVKSATVSEKRLLTKIASYYQSEHEVYVLVLNPKRALINQFNVLWEVEGEVVFPGYIEKGADVIGYIDPQKGKYVSFVKNPIIKPSVAATIGDFKGLVEFSSSQDSFKPPDKHQKEAESLFMKLYPSPFIDGAAFPKAAKAYENMPVDNWRLRRIAPSTK